MRQRQWMKTQQTMHKVTDNQQSLVAVTASSATTTPLPPATDAVAQLTGLRNAPQKPAASWSQIAAAHPHAMAPSLASDPVIAEFSPAPVPHDHSLPSSQEYTPETHAQQQSRLFAHAGLTVSAMEEAAFPQPRWQRATRAGRGQSEHAMSQTSRGDHATGRGRGAGRDCGTTKVEWQLTLPARQPGKADDDSHEQYSYLFRHWKNIRSCTEKMNLRQLNSEMGKLNRALGQTRTTLSDMMIKAGRSAEPCPLSVAEVEAFGSNITAVMAAMSHKMRKSEAPAITIAAIFSGLRALAKVDFARVSEDAATLLRAAFGAALDAMHSCPAQHHSPRMIAVCLNGLKEGVANGALSHDDRKIHAAAGWLIARAVSPFTERLQPQNVANFLSGLKTLLDCGVLAANDNALPQVSGKLLALLYGEAFSKALPIEIASGMNGLKTILDRRVLPAGNEQVVQAASRLLELTGSATFSEAFAAQKTQAEAGVAAYTRGDAQQIANILNGVKTVLDSGVLPPDNARLLLATRQLLEMVASEIFELADAQNIANTLTVLKTLLDRRVLPPDCQLIMLTGRRLLAMVALPGLDVYAPQNITNGLNGLKALLDHRVLSPNAALVRKAAEQLFTRALSSDFLAADALELANIFNVMKAMLDYGVLMPEERLMLPLACQLLAQVVSLSPGEAQQITNSLNGLKSLLEHQVLPPEDKRLRLAAEHLLRQMLEAAFSAANEQAIINGLNGLRALLEYRVLQPDSELVAHVAERLMKMIAESPLVKATAQHIANAFMGLKTLLSCGVVSPDTPWVQQAAECLMRLLASGKLSGADAHRIANGFTGLKVVLDRQVLPINHPELQNATGQLLTLVAAGAFRESILRNPAAQRQRTSNYRAMLHDGNAALNIANVFSGLKTLLDFRVVPPDAERVRQATSELLGLVGSELFAAADGRNIAYVHSCLKMVLERQVVSPNNTRLQQAVSELLTLSARYDFTQEDTQTISNTFNGVSAMLEAGIVSADNAPLRRTVAHLLKQILAPGFGYHDAQGIANTLNGLKKMLEYGVVHADEEPVTRAFCQLFTLVKTMVFPRSAGLHEWTQTIANASNGLKAALDYQVLPSDSELVREVAQQLMRFWLSAEFDGATAQGIANTLNCLRALLEYRVLPPHHDLLRQSARRLLTLVASAGFSSNVVAQNITNVLNVVLTLTTQGVVPPDAPRLKAITEILLQLGVAGALDQASGVNVHYFFRTTMLLHQQFPMLVSDRLLREKGQQLRQRIAQCMTLPDSHARAEKLTVMLVQLQQMLSSGWVEAQTGWTLCQQLQPYLGKEPPRAALCAALLSASCRLYCDWRSRQDIEISPLLEQVIGLARTTPWQAFRERRQAIELHQICTELDKVCVMLRRGKKRSGKRHALAELTTVLEVHVVPILRHAVQLRQRPGGFDVSSKEMQLFQRYLPPDQWLMPAFTPWSVEHGNRVIRDAFKRLAGAPRPVVAGGELRIAQVNMRGQALKNAAGVCRERVLASSVYNQLLDPQHQHTPILIEISEFTRKEDLPVVVTHNGLRYRTDIVRGSANKMKPGHSTWLWGVPLEMSEFMTRHLFPSTESRSYAQRMLFPQATGNESQPAPVSPALVGQFTIAMIPDTPSLQNFIPAAGWDIMCARDGCGFIHEDLARQLLGANQAARLKAGSAEPVRAEGSIPAQALQHYVVNEEECERIAEAFHLQAREQLGAPLAQREDIPYMAGFARMPRAAGPATYHATALPAAGRQLLLPDTPGWRKIAEQGVIMTRAPHDTHNLLSIAPQDIGYARQLAGAQAIQYSLTGFDEPLTPDTLPEMRFFKGLMVVLPGEAWPAGYEDVKIVLSTKDSKIAAKTDSLQSRQQQQNATAEQRFVFRGCLVVKQVIESSFALVPCEKEPAAGDDVPSMISLGGDYDGDRVKLAARADVPELAALVREQNRTSRGNPKLPKTFTLARNGELDIEKLQQLRSNLLQDASVMMERLLNLPATVREPLIMQLIPGHILEDFYHSDDWLIQAGLQPQEGEFARQPQAGRAEQIIRCELELMMKAGTDLEKTTVDFPLLWQRLKEYRRVLGPLMALPVPWGKGVAERLEQAWMQHQGTAQYLHAVREILTNAYNATQHYHGLPARIMAKNLAWLLGTPNTYDG